MAQAKTMSRSRNQLATAYAPESFFTFEGGLGACIACSVAGEHVALPESTLEQIFERINELGHAWFDAAMRARDGDADKRQPLPAQCVDVRLLDATRAQFQAPGQDRLLICRPSHMGYSPAPLAFRCRTCGLFRDYESLKEFENDLPNLSASNCRNAGTKGPCDWEQLDIVFVHWSGNWEQPFPGQYQWDEHEGKVAKRRDTCTCGSRAFRLNRRAPAIGDWFFECAACGKPLSEKWLQNDPESLRILGSQGIVPEHTDVRMQATPYRASNAYYVKSDLFIDFKDGGQDLLARLRPGRETELKDFIATRFGLGAVGPTDADVENACSGREDCKNDWLDYQTASAQLAAADETRAHIPEAQRSWFEASLDSARSMKRRIVESLRERRILVPSVALPPELEANLAQRQLRFASKFDPFRLAIEHEALRTTRLAVETRIRGKKRYVSFTRLDEDLAPESAEDKEPLQEKTRELLDDLGMADMGLIREFDLCRFSFGYTRMESGPVLTGKRHDNMPVRLNLFPAVRQEGGTKTPIYVVQQGNEALYVRLKDEVVLAWLAGLDCPDMFGLAEGERIGARLLNQAWPMGPFLDRLPRNDKPPVYLYLYTLLHSYAHLLMRHMSEYSGLDLGSLGEYIFPADLAFVVYRNGTTMDLGNLSAMWRNAGTPLLRAMLAPKATQCGTGSLCTHRGGSCPDCTMVPETSCIAGNKLLSRSVLRSIGGRPRFDTRQGAIEGYFDFAQALKAKSASKGATPVATD